jgi:hypothetical protein
LTLLNKRHIRKTSKARKTSETKLQKSKTNICCQRNVYDVFYIIKELVQPKMSLNREFLIWKERGRVR